VNLVDWEILKPNPFHHSPSPPPICIYGRKTKKSFWMFRAKIATAKIINVKTIRK
jgi:hypothetical protein